MIGNCPECEEAIRIPDGDPSDTVRCPLCSAEYALERVLGNLPPQLEIVGQTMGGIGISIDAGEDDEASLPAAKSIESGASSSRRYRPQKKRQVNAFAEILKVILGGVVAIPIGVLCVWWFAGKAPFGIAETVSEYVPWIVPEKFRSNAVTGGDDEKIDDDSEDSKSDENEISSIKKKSDRSLDKTPQGVLGIQKSISDPFGDNGKSIDPFEKNKKDDSKGDDPKIASKKSVVPPGPDLPKDAGEKK